MQAQAEVHDGVEVAEVDAQKLLHVGQPLLQRVAVDVERVRRLLHGQATFEEGA